MRIQFNGVRLAALILLTLLPALGSRAQQPLSLYYLENIPQSVNLNPALLPRMTGFIGLPGINAIYGGFHHDLI
ncbi:MAG: hypothetical protein R6V75_00775, partial [Bacteroidales bacterium]